MGISPQHEIPIRLIQNSPRAAADLLHSACRFKVPDHANAYLGPEGFTDVSPKEYRSDLTVVLGEPDAPVLAIVTEVQNKYDEHKRYSWPVYMTTLRARLRCPVVLLVLCPTARVGERFLDPIEIGHPGWDLVPLVVDLSRLPPITDPVEAALSPELALLGAAAHSGGPEGETVVRAFADTIEIINKTDAGKARQYHELLNGLLTGPGKTLWETIVTAGTYEFKSNLARTFEAEGIAKGIAKGEAKAVLGVLAARGFQVSDAVRERVTACADEDQLMRWLQRAVTVDSPDELFD